MQQALSKMSVQIYQSIRRHISDNSNLHTHCHKNLKSSSQMQKKDVVMNQDEERNSKWMMWQNYL